MPEEGFLRRWARVKARGEASGGEAVAEAPARSVAVAPPAAPVPVPVPEPVPPAASATEPVRALPTLEDAARLTHESDFSAFVSQGVDKDVRRLALKKLFADPHFNIPDRLDMYMDDYNKPDPVSATMLAALDHARSVLRRPEEVQAELARLAASQAAPEPAAPALEDELAIAPIDAPQEEGIDVPEAADPDSLVQFQPAADPPAEALETAMDEYTVAPIARDSAHAHNAETNP